LSRVRKEIIMERNDELKELRRGGETLRVIGERFGISKERVRQLTKGIIPNKPEKVKAKSMPHSLLERLERFIDKSDNCWEWTASTTKQGYGHLTFRYRTLYAHRAMWECINGEIPDGLDVLHKCDNPPCVNPDHLFLGTHQDNMKDRDLKGRGRNKFSILI
jgi:HNH endonuclease